MSDPRLRAAQSLRALRIVAATLIFIHGTSRLLTGRVAGLGEFLSGQHIPLGAAVAWAVTVMEITGTIVLAMGYLVRPLALYYVAELTMGIVLLYLPEGWFVLGGDHNGMEYSILLIATFLAIAWAGAPGRRETD